MKTKVFNQREKEIEAYFVRHVRALGGKAYKFTSPSQRGVPDRIVIFRNCMPVFVELKADGGMLSELQKIEIEFLLEMGQNVCVCIGRKGVDELIETLKEVIADEQLRRVQSADGGGTKEWSGEATPPLPLPTGKANTEAGS